MLEFHSANTRAVNPRRAIQEALELSGAPDGSLDLLLINAAVGHDLVALSEEVHLASPRTRVLAASCAGVATLSTASRYISTLIRAIQ